MGQVWHDLLFAHWPYSPELLRPLIPRELELDTFDGQAWIGIVPFRISRLRLRATPALPYLSAFAELNVRTYVISGGKPGVWFFSLDAANAAAVVAARAWYHLPYFRAKMNVREENSTIFYESLRTHRGAIPAVLKGRYQPIAKSFAAAPGTLAHWLAERYCLYAADSSRRIYRAEIHHGPWPLQDADAEFSVNEMTAQLNLALPEIAPLLHFSRLQDVRIWAPTRIKE